MCCSPPLPFSPCLPTFSLLPSSFYHFLGLQFRFQIYTQRSRWANRWTRYVPPQPPQWCPPRDWGFRPSKTRTPVLSSQDGPQTPAASSGRVSPAGQGNCGQSAFEPPFQWPPCSSYLLISSECRSKMNSDVRRDGWGYTLCWKNAPWWTATQRTPSENRRQIRGYPICQDARIPKTRLSP